MTLQSFMPAAEACAASPASVADSFADYERPSPTSSGPAAPRPRSPPRSATPTGCRRRSAPRAVCPGGARKASRPPPAAAVSRPGPVRHRHPVPAADPLVIAARSSPCRAVIVFFSPSRSSSPLAPHRPSRRPVTAPQRHRIRPAPLRRRPATNRLDRLMNSLVLYGPAALTLLNPAPLNRSLWQA